MTYLFMDVPEVPLFELPAMPFCRSKRSINKSQEQTLGVLLSFISTNLIHNSSFDPSVILKPLSI
jgi:hypothetical protein